MAVQWVVKKIKWGGLVSRVSISGWWVSVRQNTLRLGERRPSTQLLKTIQTDGKTHTDKIQMEKHTQTKIQTGRMNGQSLAKASVLPRISVEK